MSKPLINKIHQLIIRLAKSKLELQSMTPNYVVTHRNIGNFRALEAELLNKQITSIHNHLNDESQISTITEIRIEQGHKLAGLVEDFGLHDNSNLKMLEKLWKFNQTILVLLRAKEINISIRASQDSWKLCGTGIAICSLLKDKTVVKYTRVLAALDLLFLLQLLNEQGNILISWSQYMRSKDKSNRGKVLQ